MTCSFQFKDESRWNSDILFTNTMSDVKVFLTSTNRKHGTMELLLFMPGFSSPAIPLSVSLNVPLSCCLSPYSERKRGGQVSPPTKLRSTPECEIKWSDQLWMDLGVSLMSCLPVCTITALLLFLHIISVIPYYCLFICYIHEYLTHASELSSSVGYVHC